MIKIPGAQHQKVRMDSLQPSAADPVCPAGSIPATPFDQLNFACEVITDQLLHIVISFDGRLREETLGQALKEAIRCNPILGCRFRDVDRPFWEPLPALRPEELLHLHETGDPERMLRQVMVTPIEVTRTAPIRLDLIRARTDTLIITLHHAASDARGILDCTRLIANLYQDPKASDPGLVPGCGGEERSNRRYLSKLPSRATVPEDFGVPTLPPPDFFPFRPGASDARDFAIRTIPPAYLEQVRTFGKARSVTAGAVLLAATAQAFSRFRSPATEGRFAIFHSLDLRRHYEDTEPGPGPLPGRGSRCDIANRSVPFEVLFPCDEPQTLDRLVIPAADALQQFRESDGPLLEVLKAETLADGGFPAVRDHVGMAKDTYLRHGHGSPFLVNAGILPEECLDFGPDLPVTRAFLAAGISTDPPGIVLTVSTFRGRLTLSFGFCSAAIAHNSAEALLDAIVAALPGPGC